MIADLTGWIKNIVLVVLFASFLELLLPTSSMQRFVRVIVGLVIMLTILAPVCTLFESRLYPLEVAAIKVGGTDGLSKIEEDSTYMVSQREQLVMDIYKKELIQQVKAVVLAINGVTDADVLVDMNKTIDKKPGEINKITVYVKSMASNEKVAIGPDNAPDSQKLKPVLTDKVAETVRELYQLKRDQVEVKKMI